MAVAKEKEYVSGRGWYCKTHGYRLDKDDNCALCANHVQRRRDSEREFAERQKKLRALIDTDPDLEHVDSWTGMDS